MVEVEVAGGFENPSSLENDFLVIDIPFFPSSIGEPFYVLTYSLISTFPRHTFNAFNVNLFSHAKKGKVSSFNVFSGTFQHKKCIINFDGRQ